MYILFESHIHKVSVAFVFFMQLLITGYVKNNKAVRKYFSK